MKIIDSHKYMFPSHLLPALINNEQVIDSEDRDCFEAFIESLEQYRIEYGATSYIVDYEDISYFSRSNCLSDVSCDVVDIKVYFVSIENN
jgi:hypothetical protein